MDFQKVEFLLENKKNGIEDKDQGNIFFHIMKIIKKKKPKILLFENVPHLLNMDDGKIIEQILTNLEKLGYTCNYKIINSENVVPQAYK